MKILTENLKYKDRFNIELFFGDYKNKLSNDAGYFILSKDSFLFGENFSVNGCFGAYTNESFEIKGNAITLKLPGINYSKTTIARADPTLAGDLSYIDGCSNSNLISPGRNGEPCLNYLFFPKNIHQTMHTHPSCRIGFVLSGNGYAEVGDKRVDLNEGSVFLLDRYTLHNFCTGDSHMSIMVFHPDSEDGPTDEFNPMKSRTFIK